MRKRWSIVASLALTVAFVWMVGCSTRTSPDFNLIFKYSVGAKNELNTFKGTYTRDMILDPSITVKLSLSKEELDSIYQKMEAIEFFEYPDRFSVPIPPDGRVVMVTPYSSYYFKVIYDSKIKELWWEDEIKNDNIEADKLRELIKLIRDIIESKEEYKQLPPPRGGYL